MSSAIQSLIDAFKSQTNGAADGTGVLILLQKAKLYFGNSIPQELLNYTLGIQGAVFGDYPTTKDVAPSALFLAIYVIFMFAHLYIFVRNYTRGHKFWLSLLFCFYCLLRVLGFAMRISWAKDILKMKVGMASEVFIIIPIVLLASFNLVLAQRIFTWRHPHLGSTKLFWAGMITVYAVVTGVVVMAIVGALVPFIYFLGKHHLHMCQQAVQAASILCVLYSGLAITLVSAAYLLKPSAKAQATLTFQPWWIECFSPFYFVPKGSAQRAEESFANRDAQAFDHVRIIASTATHHTNTIERVQSVVSKSGKLTHNTSIFIIFLTTLILLISSSFRCASTFIINHKSNQSWIFKPVVMYIMFPTLECFVNIAYLLGRVDLRFYRPDRLSKSTRSSFAGRGSASGPAGAAAAGIGGNVGPNEKHGTQYYPAAGDETLRGSNPEIYDNDKEMVDHHSSTNSDEHLV